MRTYALRRGRPAARRRSVGGGELAAGEGDEPTADTDAGEAEEPADAEDAGGDVEAAPADASRDLIRNWNVPSWAEIVAGLHRPGG